MTEDELKQKIDMLEYRLFLTDMIDHWDSEDREIYTALTKKIKELKEQLSDLENLPKENHNSK